MGATLILRLIAACPSAQEAEDLLREVRPWIEEHAPIERHVIEPYWKFPDHHELCLYLVGGGRPLARFVALRDLAARGWTQSGDDTDRSMVWNPTPGCELLSPRVRWAELILSRPPGRNKRRRSAR